MNRWLAASGFHGAMAVAFGAWAAHGAEATLPQHAIDWVRTGSSYQLWHAVALLGIAALSQRNSVRLVTISGLAFALGALLFSGSLYLLAFGGPRILVYLTPIGGSLLILGWLLLLVAGLKKGSI
ncbi:DUF423 domain-containing protein [Dongia mobilis]|jgi:uncharacterized membrane protein YgdD (TMEM256/DUF423 family)|uniref:DUF423 domain-containing protein n=1 Tax=Dongia sp. TaxID=1977262 RepID=UPI0026EA1793